MLALFVQISMVRILGIATLALLTFPMLIYTVRIFGKVNYMMPVCSMPTWMIRISGLQISVALISLEPRSTMLI